MAEVKEFERHRRFRHCRVQEAEHDHIVKGVENARGLRVDGYRVERRPAVYAPVKNTSNGRESLELQQVVTEAGSEDAVLPPADDTPTRLLSLRPRRPPKVDGPDELSLHSSPCTSRSIASGSDDYRPRSTALPTLLAALPSPFSGRPRVVSDEHAMPSVSTIPDSE